MAQEVPAAARPDLVRQAAVLQVEAQAGLPVVLVAASGKSSSSSIRIKMAG